MRFGRQLFGMVFFGAALALAAPSAGSAQEVYDPTQLTDKPRIASPMAAQRAIEKSYPTALQRDGVAGKVVLQFVVKADGKVDAGSIVVQSADEPRLQDAAKEAVAGISFVPGSVDGNAVATRVVFPISYVAR